MAGKKPLKGKNVLVTREHSQAQVLSDCLAAQGARALACPLIAFSPPSDWSPVDRCLESLSEYDGLLFTSANAVEFTFERMQERGVPLEAVRRIPHYAVGPATAKALGSRGIAVDCLPDRFQAEGLAALMETDRIHGKRFLFPRAREAREWLPRFIEEKGGGVDLVVVYETRKAVENRGRLLELLAMERLDYLTFTSSSTVRFFVELAGPRPPRVGWPTLPAACIGEITAETARAKGFLHILTARPSTIPGLVQAIVDHAEGRGPAEGPERIR